MNLNRLFQGALDRGAVKSTVEEYARQFEPRGAGEREGKAAELARDYYQLVTDFYEFGWGESFHFAPRAMGESIAASLSRYELHLAERLQLRPGMKALDVGCGVGGPMRTIASKSQAHVTGITIAPYQVRRATEKCQRASLSHLCEVVEGDFNAMPFEAGRFDAAYTIEACCHAADRRGPFREVYRTLKPGGLFAGYDWCMTGEYVPGDAAHERIKLGIEKGNGVAALVKTSQVDAALKDAGFEILDTKDWATTSDPNLPWYSPLATGYSVQGFRNSRAGAFLTHQLVRVLEKFRLSPPGTVHTHDVLRLAQEALCEGGALGIFTPMYFWLAVKR
jgi:sterol 24-C-methyltransferase